VTEARTQPGRALSLRLPRVSPRAFVGFTVAALAALVAVTVTGATVRLTGSGLGCDNWPRCGNSVFPEKSFHPLVEFSNRGVGFVVGIVTLAAALAAFRVEGLPRRLLWGAVALPFVVLLQGVLGGIAVLTDLNAWVVMGHFLLSLLAVALGVVVVLGAHFFAAGRPSRTCPRPLAWLAVAGVPVLLALVVTGAFVTAAGPHAGGQDIPRVGNLEDALYVHVRATAVFGIGFLVLVAALVRLRRALRPELVLALALLAVILAQMAVGEVQWRNQLPWWLVLLHVSLATVVFGSMTGLAARLVARRRGT
jgi:cytochrome c oxidase assembly protein subunit 15